MTHSQGFRCKTRKVFAREYRKHGHVSGTVQQRLYHRGDRVQVMVNGSVHLGMPNKYYHGKTGVVFNVNPRAIGVEFKKLVGNTIMKKRIHVRPEHLRPSTCDIKNLERIRQNEQIKNEVRGGKSQFVQLKRMPEQPKGAILVENPKVVEIHPLPFHGIVV